MAPTAWFLEDLQSISFSLRFLSMIGCTLGIFKVEIFLDGQLGQLGGVWVLLIIGEGGWVRMDLLLLDCGASFSLSYLKGLLYCSSLRTLRELFLSG